MYGCLMGLQGATAWGVRHKELRVTCVRNAGVDAQFPWGTVAHVRP